MTIKSCLTHIHSQDVPHFDFLIFSNTFLCNLSLGWQHLHSCFLLFIQCLPTRRADLFCVFSNQVFSFFVGILRSGCYLVNYQYGAYLTVDQNLVYSYPKFLIVFGLLFCLILILKPSFSIHISVSFSFCFLLLNLVVEYEFCHQLSPTCKSCLSIFKSK